MGDETGEKEENRTEEQNTSSKDDLTETKKNETIKVRFTSLNMNINTYGDNKYPLIRQTKRTLV